MIPELVYWLGVAIIAFFTIWGVSAIVVGLFSIGVLRRMWRELKDLETRW